MKTKYIFLSLFVVVAAAQLYVPTSMILDQEEILTEGKTFKFSTQPVDPNDPFRGKYVILGFRDDLFVIPDSINFSRNEEVFVKIYEDDDGYAKIKDVVKLEPSDDTDFVKATISSVNYYNDSTRLFINYPFDRYYMEEYKAPEAETVYIQSNRDSLKTTWAVVKVKDGNAALEDVMIDGVSIKEVVEQRLNNQ